MLKAGTIYRDKTRGDFFRLLSWDDDENDWNIISASDIDSVRTWDESEDSGEWIDPLTLVARIASGEVEEV